uniref:Transposase n=1 Tax=Caenorhabditis tropicalis TaxID=1561998 RepID=A0A1I7UPR0_9PELO
MCAQSKPFSAPTAFLGDGSFYLNPLNPSYSRVVDGSTGRATAYHSKGQGFDSLTTPDCIASWFDHHPGVNGIG